MDDGRVDGTALYPLITLHEPSKQDVLAWAPGDPVSRSAFAIVKNGPDTFEAIVDTIAGEVVSWQQIDDVQSGVLPNAEFALVQSLVRGNRAWQAAARERGVEDFQDVVCVSNTTGRARVLACRSCHALVRCEKCDAAVGMDVEGGLECRRCRTTRPAVCQQCGAGRFANLRPGVARLGEDRKAECNTVSTGLSRKMRTRSARALGVVRSML